MGTLIGPDNTWPLWAVMIAGVTLCIYLEQSRRWAAKMSGPVLALIGAMILSNLHLMPTASVSYDFVDNYFVPLAIPLLLFQANAKRIFRETGTVFAAFHVAAFGSLIGAFLAAFLLRGSIEKLPEVIGIMTGSYIGGGVNFMAVKNSFDISENLSNPLIVADNFIMAGMFAVLLIMSGSRFFLKRYRHPHTTASDAAGIQNLAAVHWKRKEIALLDIGKALAVASAITAVSMLLSGWVKAHFQSSLIQSLIGNVFLLMTFFTVIVATVWPRWIEEIHGAEEIGVFLLYLFFFVIGLRADLVAVLKNVPLYFVLCLIIAGVNLLVTLALGRWLKLPLEELLLCVNATLGGAPSAAAMAIAKGWSNLILPGILVGVWGYVIGTFLGVITAEVLMRW